MEDTLFDKENEQPTGVFTLKELQLLAEAEYSVETTRDDLSRIVQTFKDKPYHDEAINVAFVQERKLPRWIADEQDLFFVDEDTLLSDIPVDLQAESLGMVRNGHIVFAGRLVYPIKDTKGKVMGFCGWDKFDRPKYLDSVNQGYKAKVSGFYGLEMMREYYSNDKPVYVVEGIVCCLYLRSVGLQAIALLGSSITPYVLQVLKRIQHKLVVIPDNDILGLSIEDINNTQPAGEHLVNQAKRYLPKATVVQSTIAKDVDDTRKFEDGKYAEVFVKDLKTVYQNPYLKVTTITIRQAGCRI